MAHCTVAFGARHSRGGVAALVVAGVVCAMPSSATAVSLGAVTQQSGLGQTLRVAIPVTLGDGEEIAAECFKLAPGQGLADGVPDLLYGRVNVERTASGTTLVVTTPRPINDPVVRITIRAGCETSVRREYTLFMDPPAIEAPVTAAPAPTPPSPREVLGLPPAEPPASAARRPPKPQAQARTATRSAQAGAPSADAEGPDKGAQAKARAAPRATPRPPTAATTAQPRLSVSSGAPGTLPSALANEADRERARQERANAIEAETTVLRQRIVELTAMVERMQAELRAQEVAKRAAAAQAAKAAAEAAKPTADAAKTTSDASRTSADAVKAADATAPSVVAAAEPAKAAAQEVSTTASKAVAIPVTTEPPVTASPWWKENSLLIAAIVALPLLIAALLSWKRRRDSAQDALWRMHAASTRPDTLTRTSTLRGTSAGVVMPDRHTISPRASREVEGAVAARDAVDALAVSELSHVTEEARVFVALGHTDRAIEVLQDHIRRLPRSMPAAWLMLLDLYHQQNNRAEFRKLAEAFHTHFNVRAPLWEEFGGESALTGGIENFPAIEHKITTLWRTPECRTYLEGLLYDNREGRRNGFPFATYSDILLLLQVLDAPSGVDIDQDLVAAGKLEGRPKAKVEAAARKSMPPEPAARPAQQPIRFEVEPPQDTSERKRR